MSTPHIEANLTGEIADVLLMPGDPLRAKFIAENFLEDVVQFNAIRNMFGYTGTYKGRKISVMGSGMGMPSIGIYSYELFKFYGVETIVRVGSAGSYDKDVNLYDVVLASDAFSESSYAVTMGLESGDHLEATKALNDHILATAKKMSQPVIHSTIHSSDVFYRINSDEYIEINKKHGAVCVEMESFALFANAKALGKNAACILTISDSLVTKEATSAEERQNSFTKMMELALESVLTY